MADPQPSRGRGVNPAAVRIVDPVAPATVGVAARLVGLLPVSPVETELGPHPPPGFSVLRSAPACCPGSPPTAAGSTARRPQSEQAAGSRVSGTCQLLLLTRDRHVGRRKRARAPRQ